MNDQLENQTLVYRAEPKGFSTSAEVAACYLEMNGKLLFLLRASNKPEGDKWGMPAGKIEPGENARAAIIREVFEETGIVLKESDPRSLNKLYIRKPNLDYTYHMFHVKLTHLPEVVLNHEHTDFRWLTEEEGMDLPIMSAGVEALQHFKALSAETTLSRKPFYFIRHGETNVNADKNLKRVDYDLPLNHTGRSQALFAREALSKIPLKRVCFSPIQRAVETKDILVENLNLDQLELDDLSECKAKIWTKMVLLENGTGYHVCPEVEDFLSRILRGLESSLQTGEGPPLVVGHGGTHWALCYHLAISNHPWKIGNCKLVHFQPKGEEEWVAEII